MKFVERKLKGLYEVHYEPYVDHRGSLTKPFNKQDFKDAGLEVDLCQVMHSYTEHRNTVRGMYIQTDPCMEGKVVAPLRGKTFWVAVDVRKGSDTFGEWDAMVLSPEAHKAFLITPGFAHGCLSLTDDVSLLLMADNHHAPDNGFAFAWDDPDVGIRWPLLSHPPIFSEMSGTDPSFANFCKEHVGKS